MQSHYLSAFFARIMTYYRFCITFINVISLALLSFVSCKKESKCDCSADTITVARIFQPDGVVGKDAVIESITPDQNTGNTTLFAVFSWTNNGVFNTARSLLEFDLSTISPQTKIKKAELSLFWKPYGNLTEHTGENAFSIYRVTQQWDESTVTWNNQPTISVMNKVTVRKITSTNQSYLNIVVTDLVQDIINDPANSHGFMFKLDDEFPYRLVVSASSDDTDKSKRPKLVITY